ncbi:5-bromo-4-chloroindolyl phosphate hydrolysis family protein [Vermiculatibacterium agrestimuris]|uniref:5-bromo-4-chloroindolyl phosphate hydrolysis family protein n=1 Tax=Vermiculatibacterium agrestimuris TaxID=2941519 RepID=UPI00203CE4EE|nr:5-bromo-4-chloroindolyl phosphate hydrolysis family protein [Vermiculatibacterium agrestimuris]
MNNKQGSEIPWWAIILGFIFFWPVGMVLLFLNLGGVRIPTDKLNTGARPQQGRTTGTGYTYHYTYTGQGQSQAKTGTGTGSAVPGAQKAGGSPYHYGQAGQAQKQAPSPKKKSWEKKIRDGKAMTILGGVMSFIFGIGFAVEFIEALHYGLLLYADEWFPIFGFLCAWLFLLGHGIGKTRLSRRQRLYMGVIGQRSSVFLSDLAGAAGVSEKRVIADIQKMLSDGILPMGYIDRASGRLVLTDQGYEPAPEPQVTPESSQAKAKKEPQEDDDAILREIRAVNDAIPGEEMTRKIDRIGEITKKILDYQRQNPAKATELRQFLNYYLPTTLKLLKTYAQLDAQGVEGDNITASKKRIEDMMDKVVEGFEKQLDQLFQTDAMDIATDVEVLERMLEKDGLGSGMTMGG